MNNEIFFKEILEKLRTKFEEKVIKAANNDCWAWKGKIKHNHYPLVAISYNGFLISISAARLSYILHNQFITNKDFVLHKCDNRICTNPTHLFIGNQKDNMQDKIKKGRHPKSYGCICFRENCEFKYKNYSFKEIYEHYLLFGRTI